MDTKVEKMIEDNQKLVYKIANSMYIKNKLFSKEDLIQEGLLSLCRSGHKYDEIIIVEGEMDKLALEQCGLKNVISVPNGAPAKRSAPEDIDNTGKFEYLVHAEDILKQAKKIILAVDADDAGNNLRWELSRRIGAEKCYNAFFPNKDANGCLIECGVDVTLDCIREAAPQPIEGLLNVSDFQDSLMSYFHYGMQRGALTGWENVDMYYTVMAGEVTVVTGVPNNGKSEWLDALCVNLAKNENWPFAVFSPENGKEQHTAKLIEKITEKPTSPKEPDRMSEAEFLTGSTWVENYFKFIVSDDMDNPPTIDWILEKARAAIFRYGIKGLIIDPYNEIEHDLGKGEQETHYIGRMLSKLKRFARLNDIHIWMVAHPAKLKTDKDGKIMPPSLYDISGSANWANKADCGIVVHRTEDVTEGTEILVRKVRFKHVGKKGSCTLSYNRKNGIYSVPNDEVEPDNNEPIFEV
jgi:twinkle protein